jgi:hypothetical protein
LDTRRRRRQNKNILYTVFFSLMYIIEFSSYL